MASSSPKEPAATLRCRTTFRRILLLISVSRTPVAGALLPRCPDAIPDVGNDRITIDSVGSSSSCANVFYRSDLRTIGGNLITYYTTVEDSDTCGASFEQAVDFSVLVNSGAGSSCKSFWIDSNVACLSSCDDPFDCYVSSTEQSLDFEDCASAAGLAPSSSQTEDDDDKNSNDGIVCYDYHNKKGVAEDAPEEKKCADPDATCASYETVSSNGFALSLGRCTTIRDFCETMRQGKDGKDITSCTECHTDLCNPIISYSGAAAGANPIPSLGAVVLMGVAAALLGSIMM